MLLPWILFFNRCVLPLGLTLLMSPVSVASDAVEVRDGMLGWAGMRKKPGQDDLGPGTFSSV